MNLEGEIALITGGSRGIGRACAVALAKEGAEIIVNYVSNASMAESVCNEISANGGRASAVQFDVSAEQRARIVRRASHDAGHLAVRGAPRAVTAARQERHDHTGSDCYVVDARTDFLDAARGLVAEQHRYRTNAITVDHRQVRVAQSGGFDPDEQFPVTR